MLCGLYMALIPQLLQNTIQAKLNRGRGNRHHASVGTPHALLLKVYIPVQILWEAVGGLGNKAG